MQRLSSGLRVNAASDDPAGMAISERLTSQIRGADQAVRNANDAISLVQTGDALLSQVGMILQRVRELSVQSANGTNSSTDRSSLDKEVQQVLQELDRIASAASFNGSNLMDGSMGISAFQVGANAGQTLALDLSRSMKRDSLGVLQRLNSSDLRVVNAGSGGAFQFAGTYTTQSIANMDFSVPASPFVGGFVTAGTPATDYSGGQAATFTVDGTSVTLNANYGSLNAVAAVIQGQLNAAHGGWYGVSTNGINITIAKTAAAASPLVAANVGFISGANANAFTGGAQSNGSAAVATTHAGLQIDGASIVINGDFSGNPAGLATSIQSQLDSQPASASRYLVTGAAAGISIAKIGGLTMPVLSGFNGTGAIVFAQAPQASLVLAAGDFTLLANNSSPVDVIGSFSSPYALADGIAAQVFGMTASVNVTTGSLELTSVNAFQVAGAQAGALGSIAFVHASSQGQGSLSGVDVLNQSNCNDAISRVDAAITQVNAVRAKLGATQNRLQFVVENLQATSSDLGAARGRISDADYAAETSQLVKSQIIQNAGMAMVTQANQSAKWVLSLLRSL